VYLDRLHTSQQLRAALVLQTVLRAAKEREIFKKERDSARIIQLHVRKWRFQRQHVVMVKGVTRLQRLWKKRRSAKRRAAAIHIQVFEDKKEKKKIIIIKYLLL
jgi:hypothetical protein